MRCRIPKAFKNVPASSRRPERRRCSPPAVGHPRRRYVLRAPGMQADDSPLLPVRDRVRLAAPRDARVLSTVPVAAHPRLRSPTRFNLRLDLPPMQLPQMSAGGDPGEAARGEAQAQGAPMLRDRGMFGRAAAASRTAPPRGAPSPCTPAPRTKALLMPWRRFARSTAAWKRRR